MKKNGYEGAGSNLPALRPGRRVPLAPLGTPRPALWGPSATAALLEPIPVSIQRTFWCLLWPQEMLPWPRHRPPRNPVLSPSTTINGESPMSFGSGSNGFYRHGYRIVSAATIPASKIAGQWTPSFSYSGPAVSGGLLITTRLCSHSSAHRRFQEWTAAGVFFHRHPLGSGSGGIRRIEGTRLGNGSRWTGR